MKRISAAIAAILLCASLAWAGEPVQLARMSVSMVGVGGGAAAACATPDGSFTPLDNEGFQTATTGYERSGWTTAIGSPNPAADTISLTSSKPTGACNQGLSFAYAGDTTYGAAVWDNGSSMGGTAYFRFYLYVSAEGVDDGQIVSVFDVWRGYTYTVGNAVGHVRVTQTSGQLQIYGYSGFPSTSTAINISTGQWYRVELKLVANGAAGTSEIKVDGGAAQTFQADSYTTLQSFGAGVNIASPTSATITVYYDLIAVSTSDYPGA